MVNTRRIQLTFVPKELNGENLEAIAEGGALLASGKVAHLTKGHDLIEAAMG